MLRRNRIQWILPIFFLFILVSMTFPDDVVAQGAPATIRGTIRGMETGDMLDYANVLLVGTTRGTMSLGGGVFYFNGMSPGTYTIKVLYLGYGPMEQTVTVRSGETANLQFELETVIVEQLQAFDVEGQEYMVEVKSAVTEHKISSDTFQKYAIDSVEDALAKQAGVVSRAGELYVRGGRSGEVKFQVDGVSVDNPLGGRRLEVSTLTVENTSMVTGGLDAKYGNALSGVVNLTTKEGGSKFGGGFRFLTNDFGRQDRTYTNFDRVEYGFGGPTPIKGLTYYISGDLIFDDTEHTSRAHRDEYKVNVGDVTLFKFRPRQTNAAKGSTKLAYKLNEDMKVTGEYTYSISQTERYRLNWDVQGYARRIVYMPLVAYRSSLQDWWYTGWPVPVYYGPWYENMLENARTVMVVDSRSASEQRVPMPIMEVRAAHDNRLYTVVASASFDGFAFPFSSFSTVELDSSYTAFNSADNMLQTKNLAQIGKIIWRHNITESTFYTMRLGLVAFDKLDDVQGKDPWEYNHGGIWNPGLFFDQDRYYSLNGDYYTDPLSPYFVTSSDFGEYEEEYSRTYSFACELVSNRYEGHFIETGFGVTYNDLERYALANPGLMRQDRFTLEYSQGGNRNVFHTYNPEAFWYMQDRWEHEGMVVNYGLRWDMFSPGSAAAIDLVNEDVDRNVIKYKTSFQPRLGFAFPITERDGFHFHYGRFIQFPGREHLFASQDPVGNNGTLGNPDLEPMMTVQYSAGIVHQFTDFLAGQFSLYSKDIFDLISATQATDTATGITLIRSINKAYASARGIEATLNKRFSDRYQFRFSYTYSFADGVASDTNFGANADGMAFLPNQELPLNWDQRHTMNMMIAFQEPNVWLSSFTFTYGSGFPWTPVDRFAKKVDPMLENSERFPALFSLDTMLSRDINFYGKRLALQLQGWNLLNQDVIMPPGGGGGINPGMINGAVYGGMDMLTETGKYGAALLVDEDGNGQDEFIPVFDPRTFGAHRLFRLGVGYYF
ncbi:MAG: TonB-dependent receptor [Gemmatimonadales bacterium]|nr:TonB-dependent receptor [Gemmatimonadales bacterium]